MYATLDIGNTRSKLVVFNEQGKIIVEEQFESRYWQDADRILSQLNVECGLACSVVGLPEEQPELPFVEKNFKWQWLRPDTPVPIQLHYKSRSTLGMDRLAASIGAFHLFPGVNVLIIDAGSCITYDIVTADGKYIGGAISPGLRMRFKALSTFTKQLPEIHPGEFDDIVGKSTHDSIRTGVQYGLIHEIHGFIDTYTLRFGKIQVVITGGDADYLAANLKNKIFVRPNLIPYGLYKILQFNKQ